MVYSNESHTITFKILLIGDQNVGKTALMNLMTKNCFDTHIQPTLGVDFSYKLLHDLELSHFKQNRPYLDKLDEIKIQLWDASGSPWFKKLIKSYFYNLDALIIVCDLSNRESFENITTWYETYKSVTCSENLAICLVGNKRDITSDTVKESELAELAGNFAKQNSQELEISGNFSSKNPHELKIPGNFSSNNPHELKIPGNFAKQNPHELKIPGNPADQQELYEKTKVTHLITSAKKDAPDYLLNHIVSQMIDNNREKIISRLVINEIEIERHPTCCTIC